MVKIFRFVWCCFLVLPLVAFVGGTMGDVSAQEKRSFLDKLFGRNKVLVVPPPSQADKRMVPLRERRQMRKTQTRRKSQAGKRVQKPLIEKSIHAKRVLVIGDFVASAMAEGLIQSYIDNPDLVVLKHSETSSGLVRDDYYDWPGKAAQIIAAEKPDMILVAVGGNDRQAFRIRKNMLGFGEPAWLTHYQSRIDLLTEQLQKSTIPWGWVGLPPFKKATLSQSAIIFNSLYKDNAEKHGAAFIDIWSGFVDGEGNFSFSGYDVNGQTVRLRNNDGINFTSVGYRKLAFYAEPIIRTLLEDVPLLSQEKIQTEDVPAPVLPQTVDRVAPIGLWEIGKGMTVLAGETLIERNQQGGALSNSMRQPTQKLRPQVGRADYFSLTEP